MDTTIIALFLVFASVVLGIYYLVPRKYRYLVILIASFVFYCIYSNFMTIFIVLTILTIYFAGVWIFKLDKKFERQKEGLEKDERKKLKAKFKVKKNWVVACAIIFNLAMDVMLILFRKYGLVDDMYRVLHWGDLVSKVPILKIGIPLGISYYTLSAIGYLVDINRGKYKPETNFLKVALFVLYFPQLLEGPFANFDKLAPQLYEGVDFDRKRCENGLLLVIWGFIKKIVIADRLAIVAGEIFKNFSQYNGLLIIVGILAFTFQLYAEFSGIIDIVRGISKMFGFELAQNFDQPFYSKNVNEFWRRWHMSLGAWFREYVFYSISMSKPFMKLNKKLHGRVKPFFEVFIPSAIALFFVWLCNGLWHGAGVQYIVYGMYYYVIMMIGMCFEPLFKKLFAKMKIEPGTKKEKTLNILRVARTFVLVNIGMLIFRANSLTHAWDMFASIFSGGKWLIPTTVIDVYDIVLAVLGVVVLLVVDALKEHKIDISKWVVERYYILRTALYVCMVIVVLVFGAYGDGYVPVDPIYGGF